MSASKFFRRYRAHIATAVLVAVAGGAYLVLRNGNEAEAAITYETEAVTVGTVSVTVSGTGTLEVDGTTEVYSAVSGTVASVAVAEGAAVTTGTVLFTLDAASAEAATAKALASLRQAEQGVAQAQLQLTKAQNALASLTSRSAEASSTVTSAEIAAAQGDVSVASAQLASARAQASTAAITYEQTVEDESDLEVTAPCSGMVYDLSVAAGDSVSAASGNDSASGGADTSGMNGSTGTDTSSAPVTIAPVQPLAVHLTVNEVDLPSLEVGQRADVELDALPDLTATGKVYEIGSVGSNSSGVVTFDVWVALDVADPALRAGMSAAATIVTDVAKGALVVSNSAVQSDGNGGYYVQVLSEAAEKPQRVAIETGLASATQTQVLSGLAEGDVVVTQTLDGTEETDTRTPGSGGGMMVPGMGGGFRD